VRLFVGAGTTVSQVAAAEEGCGSAACVSCSMRVVDFLVCITQKRADVAGHNSNLFASQMQTTVFKKLLILF
jgi:fibrillarin-like rRNA methylase